MGYDAAGNLAWSAAGLALPATTGESVCADAQLAAANSGRRVQRSYDARNRPLSLSFPDGRGNQTFVYTPDGLPSQITTTNNSDGTAQVVNTYSYNRRRMLTAETVGHPGWYEWQVGYGYDGHGHLASQSYPSGLSVAYAPNAVGQATQAGSYATGVQYHPNGAIKQFTYGNGIVHTMTQNARQLPASSTDTGGALSQQFTYDRNGNVTVVTDALDNARSKAMAYDDLDRLTSASAPIFGGNGVHEFAYDPLDNLRSWKLAGVKDFANYVYDANNRLAEIRNTAGATVHAFGYDVQGNVVNKDSVGLDFDYGNRLREVTGQEYYRYDGMGRRVTAWRPSGGNTLSMYTQSGQVAYQESEPLQKRTDHIYLSGSLVATREVANGTGAVTTKYQHTDALGSPVAISNEAGALVERTNYDPYGGAIGKVVEGVGYTGHVMDPATGLTYMQQRYYDQGVGRFLSVDPIATDSNSGQGFNVYQYAANSPYRFFDPDGRKEKGPVLKVDDSMCKRRLCDGGAAGTNSAKRGSERVDGEVNQDDPEAMIVTAISRHNPDTYGATVEFDPTLGSAGSHIGDHTIVIGPKALESVDYLASVIEHEGVHISQELSEEAGTGLRGVMNEVEAYRHILENRVRFRLTPKQVAREVGFYNSWYRALPDEMKKVVDEKFGGKFDEN